MKIAILLVAVLGLSLVAATAPAYAAFDTFLEIEGVDGESQVVGHENEIEVLSFSWGASNTPVVIGGGGGAGKATASDLEIQKSTDSTSPKILEKLFTGAHIPKVELTLTKSSGGGQVDYYKVTLEDVLISSYNIGGSSDVPTESISFNFAKITVAFTPHDETGKAGTPVTFGWDLALNKKI